MPKLLIPVPPDFSFRFTIRSHGWYDLAPFVIEDADETLGFVFSSENMKPSFATMRATNGAVEVAIEDESADVDSITRDVRHILRLDDDLSAFYASTQKLSRVEWASNHKAGRLLRSPTVWEDLVKTICTTNCTWSVTRGMVAKLVEHLGEEATCGRRAFPTPEAMASRDAAFYRETIRAGYRSDYFAELALSVAEIRIDPESWLTSELSTADLKKEMKKVKGVGDYAAENLLKLVGRYDGMALDSWLRAGFYKKHNGGKKCEDKKIEKHYGKFGDWKGLAIWCDMTEDWFIENAKVATD